MAMTVSDEVKQLVEAIQATEAYPTADGVLIDALHRLQAEIEHRELMEHVRRGYEQLDRGESSRLDLSERGTFLEQAKQMLSQGERPSKNVIP